MGKYIADLCPDCGAELVYVGIQLVGNAPMESYDCPECGKSVD